VLNQTRPPEEVIVVDDGSTDGTATLVASYGDTVKLVKQQNVGPAGARNRGVRSCSGDLLCFQDSDDLWVEDKLEQQVERFVVDAELGVCTGMTQNFWELEIQEEEQRMQGSDVSRPQAGVSTAMMVRATAFNKVGLFNPRLRRMDTAEWFIRAREAGVKFHNIDAVLVRRRLHQSNLSRETPEADEMFAILQGRKSRVAALGSA
jgi:glycosyltransferase involved in cell wall biosynthesis